MAMMIKSDVLLRVVRKREECLESLVDVCV